MNDIRRTILWVIFGFSMVLLWDQWQVHNGQKATFFPSPAKPAVVATTAPAASTTSVPVGQVVMGSNQISAVDAAQPAPARERLVVSTDVLKLSFDTEGGSLVEAEFLKHRDLTDQGKNFVLLDQSKDRVYLAQTGLIAGAAGGAFPTHKTLMTVASTERELKDGSNELVVKFESRWSRPTPSSAAATIWPSGMKW
jgi:YidC/Oxa1 family membrane protein insertase